MELDYFEIGKRLARRRKDLGLKQTEVCERAGINDKYLPLMDIHFGLHNFLDCRQIPFLHIPAKSNTEYILQIRLALR